MGKRNKAGRFFSSLRFKLLLIVIIALLPAFSLIVYTAVSQRQDAAQNARENAARLAFIAQIEQEDLINEAFQLLTVLSRLPEIEEGDYAAATAFFRELMEDSPRYHNLGVADPQGNTLVSAQPAGEGLYLANELFFQRAMQTRAFSIGDYLLSQVTKTPILVFAYPVLDEEGEVEVMLLSALKLSWLNDFAAGMDLPPDSVLLIVDGNATIIARQPDPEGFVGQSLPENPVIQAVLARPQGGTMSSEGMDGIPRLYTFAPLFSADQGGAAFICVGFSESVIYSDANNALARNLIILGLITVFIMLLAWALSDVVILKKVRGLVETTKRLGDGDLAARSDIPYGSGELGRLAGSFDAMAESLQSRNEERERAAESLRSSEERLAGIMETVPIGIVILDKGGNITFANAAAEQTLGLERSDISGRAYNDPAWRITAVDGGPFPDEELPFSRVLAAGRDVRGIEHAIAHPDGTMRILSVSAAPLHDAEGAITGVVASLWDITERKLADIYLQASESRFRELFENMSSGVAIYEALEGGNDFVFKDFNRAAERIDKADRNDLIGKRVTEAFPGVRDFGLFDVFQRVWRSGNPELLPVTLYMDERESGWRENYVYKLPSGEIVAIYDDVTERKKVEQELRESRALIERRVEERTAQLEAVNRELEAFSYSVSHDLRSPLRGINGFSQALLEDYQGKLDEQAQDYLRRIRAASQRMAQLIDDMLGLSRVSRSEMHRETVDLSSMVKVIAEEFLAREPMRRVDLLVEPGIESEGDPVLLWVALNNLLDNAFKFTAGEAEARIEFGYEERNGRRVFFIRDNGVGFDMEYAEKLFGVFQRLHSMTEFPGTGVGLATVQRIIHRHGGEVWGEGVVGRGAVFYFTLAE
jgi:PAS domain S-box-containing protein